MLTSSPSSTIRALSCLIIPILLLANQLTASILSYLFIFPHQKTGFQRLSFSCQSLHLFLLLHTHFFLCFVYSVTIFHYFQHNTRYAQAKPLHQFTSRNNTGGSWSKDAARSALTRCPRDNFLAGCDRNS